MATGLQYLALLRGINVGGKNLVKMADLRAIFEEMGFDEVATYVRKPLTAKRAIGLIEIKEGVDSAWAGKGVLYHSRLAAKASSSRLSKLVARPEYQEMTVRSWSTTTKLLALMKSRAPG